MTKARRSYRALRSFTCPRTVRDWKKAAAERTDPTIERRHVAAGELVTPPCDAALRSWRANDLIEEVSEDGGAS